MFFQVPAYIATQIIACLLACVTMKLIFKGKEDQFIGTMVSGSYLQGFVVEFLITFFLMFVVCGVATDSRAVNFRLLFAILSIEGCLINEVGQSCEYTYMFFKK